MARPPSTCALGQAILLLAGLALLSHPAAMAATAGAPGNAGRAAADEAYRMPDFDRYSPIIGRMPFGLPPVVLATNTAVTGADKLAVDPAKNYILSIIVRTPAGELAVGFTDNTPKPPRSLLLAVGEESDGYRALSADIDSETATIEKDGARIELKMNTTVRAPAAGTPGIPAVPMRPGVWAALRGGDTNVKSMIEYSARMVRRAPDAPPAPAADQPVPNSVGGIDRLLSSGIQDNSYVGRLRDRREQILKQTEEERTRREQEALARAQNASKEEVDKRLRETNINLIRKGLKPIGTVELTPEEDAKLVAEGVLPAR